ncbi:MAG: hypothetical protein ACRDGE_12480 [Candidatus Limnocylindria bacterium]
MTARWSSLGGRLASGPAAAAWGSDETEVFAVHENGQLWDRYWDGKSWHAWESLGGDLAGQPGAAARSADRIDVFAIGRDGVLRQRWWDGREWVPWRAVPGAPAGATAVACAWIGERLDVFVRSADGDLWYAALREG